MITTKRHSQHANSEQIDTAGLTSLSEELKVKNNIWQLQEAKSKFSQLVENAMQNEPEHVNKKSLIRQKPMQ